jgi:CheY-like chemotaxis protein
LILALLSFYAQVLHEQVRRVEPLRAASVQARLDGVKVLLIDDETDVRAVTQEVLRNAGTEVVLGATADEGLELRREDRPAVIRRDIAMPLADGYELIRRVRALRAGSGDCTGPGRSLGVPEQQGRRLRVVAGVIVQGGGTNHCVGRLRGLRDKWRRIVPSNKRARIQVVAACPRWERVQIDRAQGIAGEHHGAPVHEQRFEADFKGPRFRVQGCKCRHVTPLVWLDTQLRNTAGDGAARLSARRG